MAQVTMEQAERLIKANVTEQHLFTHARAVSAAMGAMAEHFGADKAHWEAVGYLHDVDYEKFPEEHLAHTRELLSGEDIDESDIRAILSHGYGICTDVEPQTDMEKSLFADDLCYDLSLGLVCNSILIVKHGAIGKILENTVNNVLCILSAKCRAGNDLCKITDFAVSVNGRKDLFFFDGIDLIDNQDYRNPYLLKLLGNMPFACPDEGGGFYQPHNGIYLFQGTFCHSNHILSQFIFGLMDTRCVQEYDLSLITCIYGLDPVSCSLGLFRSNSDLLADQMVH